MRGKDGKTLEESMMSGFSDVEAILKYTKQNRTDIQKLNKKMEKSYQKVGIVKYVDDASLDQIESAIQAELDAKGRRIKVHKLPLPKPVTITAEECDGLDLCDGEPTRTPGERLAASYVNFYIANEAVVMPAFGDPMDEKAQAILQELFPTRKVVAIAARDILIGGGNIHCVTQQIPKI